MSPQKIKGGAVLSTSAVQWATTQFDGVWGFFEFVHNVRKRGKALLPALIELLVT